MFVELDSWVTAACLAMLLLVAWSIGRRCGRLRGGKALVPSMSRYVDGVLALFGLLLAFTYSAALDQHHARKHAVVEDAGSIASFLTAVELLPAEQRAPLEETLRAYVANRLDFAHSVADEAWTEAVLAGIDHLHTTLRAQVADVVATGTPLTEPLVDSLQAMVASAGARLAARRDRVQPTSLLVLILASATAFALLGWQHDSPGTLGIAATVSFVALVCLVVWVILDLNQPYRGWMRISQEPLERLAVLLKG